MNPPKDILEAGGFSAGQVVPYNLPGLPEPPRFLAELGLGEDPLAVEPPARPFLLARFDGARGSGWLPSGEVGMLAAAGGCGKTTLAVQLSLSIATGRDFLGMHVVEPGSVLLVLGEEDLPEIQRKLHHTARGIALTSAERALATRRIAVLPLVGKSARLLAGDRGRFERTPLAEQLEGFLAARGDDWRLVVLDPFSRFCAPEAEVDNAIASETVQAIASLTKAPGGPTVIVCHHVTKTERTGEPTVNAVRGAGALTDESRWVALLWSCPDEPETVQLRVRKSNYGEPGPAIVLRRSSGGVLRLATPAERAAVGLP